MTENMLSRRTGEDLGSGSLNESLTLGTVDVTDYNNPSLAGNNTSDVLEEKWLGSLILAFYRELRMFDPQNLD